MPRGRPPLNDPRRMRPRTDAEWIERLELIPGYDPFACEDLDDYYFDDDAAWAAVRFFHEFLRFSKGHKKGKPFLLELWQQAFVMNLFGWKRVSDDTRRYRSFFLYLPRKNGKTELVAGIALCVMMTDGEPGAEIYCAAAETEQASLLLNAAKSFVAQDAELSNRLKVMQVAKRIVWEPEGAFFRAISADAKTKHGFNAHMAIVDELHVQKNGELVEVLETSMGARRQPIMGFVTTADYVRESICNERLDYAKRVRDGLTLDSSHLPVVYEADKDEDDWRSPDVWKRVNPNLGVSIGETYLADQCKKAMDSPAFENTFKRLYLNMQTEQDVRWMPLHTWDESQPCGDPIAWRERMLEELVGERCFGGLDLASKTDTTAFVLAFPPSDSREHWAVVPWVFLPTYGIEEKERKKFKAPLARWIAEGFIETMPGKVINYSVVRDRVRWASERYNMVDIGIDRWEATQIIQQFTQEDGIEAVAFGQGFASMSAPTKEMERLTISGQLDHGGNPVLRWMVGNVAIEQDSAGNMKPCKKRSGGKIDAVAASIMAIGRAMAHIEEPQVELWSPMGL
jgi:phage terminase large subunit-like protein